MAHGLHFDHAHYSQDSPALLKLRARTAETAGMEQQSLVAVVSRLGGRCQEGSCSSVLMSDSQMLFQDDHRTTTAHREATFVLVWFWRGVILNSSLPKVFSCL